MPGAGAVVVGGSLAGLRAAEGLRRGGYEGTVTVVGSEPHLPYDRPPLSKQLLAGKVGAGDVGLPLDRVEDVEWRLGTTASGLDLGRRVVAIAGGGEVPYELLVLATGSGARRLPAVPDRPGVHLLRTIDDAVALRDALAAGSPRVVVVGAGVIGLEVASSARARGLEVTVLEAAPLPMARVVGASLGPVVAALHRDHGVDLRLGVSVAGLAGGARVEAVTMADGEVVPADVVVVGVGASPATGWLAGSGVDVDDGVLCDSRLRVRAGGAVLPDVVAAGDLARWDLPGIGPTRIEHWTNASDQGPAAAAALLRGDAAPEFAPVPYVWSDQHGKKLQVVGLPRPGDEIAVVDGSFEERRFVAAYGRDGRLVAAVGLSRPAKVMALRARIEARAAFPPDL